MSSKARGIEGGEGFELAQPQKLVELATSSDTNAPSVRIVRLRPRAPALDIAARLQVVP